MLSAQLGVGGAAWELGTGAGAACAAHRSVCVMPCSVNTGARCCGGLEVPVKLGVGGSSVELQGVLLPAMPMKLGEGAASCAWPLVWDAATFSPPAMPMKLGEGAASCACAGCLPV